MADWLDSGRLRKAGVDSNGGIIFESTPSGLKYITDSSEGHRIAHVLKHTDEAAARLDEPHGVFNSSEDIIEVIEEAWQKKLRDNIGPSSVDDPEGFNIELDRVIGYEGGPAGSGKPTKFVRVVVRSDGTLRTAFPVIP